MRRRLLNLLTAVSLVLCLAALALWPYSYFAYDAIGFCPSLGQRRLYGLLSHYGTICAISVREGDGVSRWMSRHTRTRTGRPRIYGTAGFVLDRDPMKFIIGVPYWAVCLSLAVPPLLWVRQRRRQRDPGLCPSCGYDLRATPDRCPECGSPARTTPA